MKKNDLLLLILGLLLGVVIGRLIPPSAPAHWNQVAIGMHYEKVYEAVPRLRRSMRELKGFDVCSDWSGKRYWQLFVYYDEFGRVSEVEKHFHWR